MSVEYDNKTLHALQQVELEILQEIIRVCEKCNIRYFAIGGTNLGAMRHDGFIPWDDDIDLGMLRDDYDRFLAVAPVELKKGYSLQWFGNEPKVPVIFAKVRKDGTRFVEIGREGLDMNHGIFVDIMPFDKAPLDARELETYRRKARMWREILIAKSTWKITVHVPQPTKAIATAFRATLHLLLKPVNKKWIFEQFDTHLKRYNACSGSLYTSQGNKHFDCDYRDLIPPQPHAFEGISIMIPANPEKMLTTHYGNWRELPPEEKRRNHAPQDLRL